VVTAHQHYGFVSDWVDRPPVPSTESPPGPPHYQRRALLIWPGLDRARLRRAHGDPWKIARLVATRTNLPIEAILTLLMGVGPAMEAPTGQAR